MEQKVTFSTLTTQNHKQIGVARLNKPAALNALDLDMIHLLTSQLLAWQADDKVVAVVLDSDGDKAFCAGGDVVAMHTAMKESPGEIPAGIQAFFRDEYQLDYLIHTYMKPFLVWGKGIVMGGGLGLMSGGSHRIVTETSRIAMPEITIGLYPDVGGSWFLNQMPGGCGLFLGLTGASINAADALYIKLADHFISNEQKSAFMAALEELNWVGASDSDGALLSGLCADFEARSRGALPAGNVEAHQALIDACTQGENTAQVVHNILSSDDNDDKWLAKAKRSLSAGSPITMHLVVEQLRRGKSLTLAECFQMEMIMSCRCGEFGEFQEGVRALLIDKDNQPAWRFQDVGNVPSDVVERFFHSPWPEQDHPLAALGKE